MTTIYDIAALQARIAELEADNARMRAALEAVEWDDAIDGYENYYYECPWCGNDREYGHKPSCQRQLALGLEEKP